jgi:hypothetical protein
VGAAGFYLEVYVASVRKDVDWFSLRGLLKENDDSSCTLPMKLVGFIFSFNLCLISKFLETLELFLTLDVLVLLFGILNSFVQICYNSII